MALIIRLLNGCGKEIRDDLLPGCHLLDPAPGELPHRFLLGATSPLK
jgi:hypothetical protein